MPVNMLNVEESNWHDPDFNARLMRAQNRRFHKKKRPADFELYVHEGRAFDEQQDRKYDRAHPKPRGRVELSTPKVFSETGELAPAIANRISAQQQTVGEVMYHGHGLKNKARRVVCCGVFGRRLDCSENPSHRYYSLLRCGLRYCPCGCGRRAFVELFHKHMRLQAIVGEVLARAKEAHGSAVIATMDFSLKKKSGSMPSAEDVRKFNQDIRQFFRAFEKHFGISRKQYGILWCDEFGSGNANLHAHAIYCGPWVSKKKISKLWASIREDGSFGIALKIARSFELALSHCLKYPSKFFDAPGGRLADLEKAFHRVRRVHAMAAFYNPKIEREPGEDDVFDGGCPECKARLGESISTKKGWEFVDVLERENRFDLEVARIEAGRKRVFDPDCPFLVDEVPP